MTPTYNLCIPQHCSSQHHVRLYIQKWYTWGHFSERYERNTKLYWVFSLKTIIFFHGFPKIHEITSNSTSFWQLTQRNDLRDETLQN